jgi:membrane-associated phospholipid phosphatase
MAFGLFQGDYTSVKNGLPVLRGGFIHDTAQANLDALIHFGTDPWHFLQKIAGYDIVRTVVEWNYNVLWFLICFGALFYVATSPMATHIRSRYLACFCAIWVLIGNIFAGVFLSAGPAFYGLVTGDAARFGTQLDFLALGASSPNSAASYQNYLWTLYERGEAGFASGISAFPSVHVALIMLNALFLYEHNRRLGMVAFAYVLFVAASSVYLAWHYAIDGYASMAITAGIYFVVKKWAAARRERGNCGAEAMPTGSMQADMRQAASAFPRKLTTS